MKPGLAADVGTMPLKDVSLYLGNRRASGVLELEREGVRKAVTLEEGAVVGASSNQPREYLGQFLMNLGHINEEQFNRAWRTQQETKIFFGRILVMIGLLEESTVATVLALKFRETLLEAFEWPDGAFRFEPGEPPEGPDGLTVRVGLLDVHRESDFRQRAWQQFRGVFPSSQHRLTVNPGMLEGPPRPGSLDEKIVLAAQTPISVEELALSLHATDFFLYQRLFAMQRLGAVTVHAPASRQSFELDLGASDSGLRRSAEERLLHARVLLGQGTFREAYAQARAAQALGLGGEAQLLQKQVEAAWLPVLKAALLGRGLRPTARVHEVAGLPLTAAERYLLSRVDGQRDLDSLVRVAPVREFEALMAFDRFSLQGWVALAPGSTKSVPARGVS